MVNAGRIRSFVDRSLRVAVASSLIWIPLCIGSSAPCSAQEDAQSTELGVAARTSVVPQQVRYAGKIASRPGDTVEAVFRIYAAPEGGDPIWTETQQVTIAEDGSYSVLLGGASSTGLPQTVFAGGAARWLGVSIDRAPEQERALLSSVPYAMKSADAETLGGLSAQNFVTHAQLAAAAKDLAAQASPQITPFVTPTGSGIPNDIPLWTSPSILGNSVMVQSGGNIEIGSASTPAALQVAGNISNFASGTYPNFTSSAYNSASYEGARIAFNRYDGTITAPTVVKPNDTVGWFDFFAYDGSTADRVGQFSMFVDATPSSGVVPGRFEIETADSTGEDTPRIIAYSNDNIVMATHSGQVGIGTGSPAATLEVNGTAKFDGNITFASTQTFPVKGTGGGTITSIATTSPLTGSATSGAVTIGLNAATLESTLNSVYAQLGAANTFTGADVFNGRLTANASAGTASITGNGTMGVAGVEGTTDSGEAVYGNATGNGSIGVYGVSDGAANGSASPIGVEGLATGTEGNGMVAVETGPGGYGIYAHANGAYESTGRYAPVGVYALSENGNGVLGISSGGSGRYNAYNAAGYTGGVWGDTSADGSSQSLAGIVGSADDNDAGYFVNNSASSTTLYATNESAGGTGLFRVFKASTRTGTCGIGDGDLICTGQVKTLATTGGGAHTVETYAMQSPENWMEDFGSGLLQNGVAVVTLDPSFAETVSATADYHVFLTPRGDSKGLYVINATPTSFEVRESSGGTSSLSFDYRIVAKRRGYETQRLTDVTDKFKTESQLATPSKSRAALADPRVQPQVRKNAQSAAGQQQRDPQP